MASEIIARTALFFFQAALIAVTPVVILSIGSRIINGLQDARLPWTPYIELVAFLVGVAAGIVILIHNVDWTTVGPSQVFRVGGPWDLTFTEFLAEKANPLRYDLSSILTVPFSGELPTAVGFAVFVVGGAVIYAPVIYFRSPRSISNAFRNAFVMVCGAYFTVLGFNYFLWLADRLNFWIFVLVMYIIHLRSRTERIVLRLN